MTDTDLGGADKWAQRVLQGQHQQISIQELEENTSTNCSQCGSVTPVSPCPTCKDNQ